MTSVSVWFLDIWTFALSQVGLVLLGVLIGYWFGGKVKSEVLNLVDKIDGKVGS
jgi:hypothetical protein